MRCATIDGIGSLAMATTFLGLASASSPSPHPTTCTLKFTLSGIRSPEGRTAKACQVLAVPPLLLLLEGIAKAVELAAVETGHSLVMGTPTKDEHDEDDSPVEGGCSSELVMDVDDKVEQVEASEFDRTRFGQIDAT